MEPSHLQAGGGLIPEGISTGLKMSELAPRKRRTTSTSGRTQFGGKKKVKRLATSVRSLQIGSGRKRKSKSRSVARPQSGGKRRRKKVKTRKVKKVTKSKKVRVCPFQRKYKRPKTRK